MEDSRRYRIEHGQHKQDSEERQGWDAPKLDTAGSHLLQVPINLLAGMMLLLAGTLIPAWALFESDRELSNRTTVSMIKAIQTAEQARPGKTVEANIGKDEGHVVYKIEIVDGKSTYKCMSTP